MGSPCWIFVPPKVSAVNVFLPVVTFCINRYTYCKNQYTNVILLYMLLFVMVYVTCSLPSRPIMLLSLVVLGNWCLLVTHALHWTCASSTLVQNCISSPAYIGSVLSGRFNHYAWGTKYHPTLYVCINQMTIQIYLTCITSCSVD